jgi:hypothetical protein
MTSKSEDDALAEQQIQMSLQCTANDLTGSQDSCGSQEQAQLGAEIDNLVEDAPKHGPLSKAQSPSMVAFPRFSKPCELSTSPEHADIKQPATSYLHGRQMLQSNDNPTLRELGGFTAHSSTFCMATKTGEAQQEQRNGATDSQLGTHQLGVNPDPDVSMKHAGTPAADSPATGSPQKAHQSAIGAAPAPLNKPTTAVSASTFVNPWAKFANIVNAGSFATDTAPTTFRPENGCPSTATIPRERREQFNDQSSAPHLLNEHVANSQRPVNYRPHQRNEQDEFGAVGSSRLDTRTHNEPAPDSVVVARENGAIARDPKMKLSVPNNKHDGFFDGLHPSRLSMISTRNVPKLNEITVQLLGGINNASRKSNAAEAIYSSIQQNIAKNKKRQITQVEFSRVASNTSDGNPKTKISKLDNASTGTAQLDDKRNLRPLEQGTAFAIAGIESLVRRYRHLNSAMPPGQEWFFAWLEATAILRTPVNYNYVEGPEGVSVVLHTNFKVFRFRGPFINRTTARGLATKKAVLHVLDGPYRFKKAAPALEGELPAPTIWPLSL